MFDGEDRNEDFAALRQKKIEEREAFLQKFLNDPLFVNALKELGDFKESRRNSTKAIRRKRDDSVFRFSGTIPLERRSSARLQNKKPDYSYLDLPEERQTSQSDDWSDLEEVVYRVKQTRKSTLRHSAPARIIPVEEVTEDMIKNIQTSGNKVYGQSGSSCHQCRQKTIDTKTICRSGFCVGVRGQFCGICVINRYGEDPVEALKDPNWKCYVCRGCCNCSFCRIKEGKRPTGILAPMAKMNGFKSVMEFLQNLRGYGDYADPLKDPENLLGFDDDEAVLTGDRRIKIKCNFLCGATPRGDKLTDSSDAEEPTNLLGFDGNNAVYGGNESAEIKCSYDVQDFLNFVNS